MSQENQNQTENQKTQGSTPLNLDLLAAGENNNVEQSKQLDFSVGENTKKETEVKHSTAQLDFSKISVDIPTKSSQEEQTNDTKKIEEKTVNNTKPLFTKNESELVNQQIPEENESKLNNLNNFEIANNEVQTQTRTLNLNDLGQNVNKVKTEDTIENKTVDELNNETKVDSGQNKIEEISTEEVKKTNANKTIEDLAKDAEKDNEGKEKSSQIMLSANDEERNKVDDKGLKFDRLMINQGEQATEENIKKISFGDSGIALKTKKKSVRISYWKILIYSTMTIIVSVLLSLGFYFYAKYVKLAVQPVIRPPYDQYVDKFDNAEQFIAKYLPWNDYELFKNTNILGSKGYDKVKNIVNSDRINYLHKKNILQGALNGVFTQVLTNYGNLSQVQQDITKYGFLTEELYSLTQNKNQDMAIQKSLLSLEIIKFSSAINVFAYLDTFLNSFSNNIGLSKSEAQQKIESIIDRGESDILVYLNNCYLNPYERNYDCEVIDDFDVFYDLIKEDSDFDKKFFKQLMENIDDKLENSDIPSFSILFKKFDPSQKEISFDIEVNTFQKDEITLAQEGIVNPHIFVVTQLLNLLKQSMFIVGKTIDVKELKVEPKIILIGNNQYSINHSKLSFKLPIQKDTQREIFDFVDFVSKWENEDIKEQTISTSSAASFEAETTSNEENTDENNMENEVMSMTFSLGDNFARSLAATFLQAQKDNATVAFDLQEIGEDTVLDDWEQTIETIKAQGLSNEEISEIVDFVINNENRKNTITTLPSLLKEDENGQSNLEKIQEEMNPTENIEATIENTGENLSSTGFWGVRDAFEQGQ